MATRERLIIDSVIAALKGAQISGVEDRVYEDRGFSIGSAELPAIDVTLVDTDQQVLDIGDFALAHVCRVEIAVLVAEGLGVAPTVVADPIVASVHRVVMQSTSVSALARAITPDGTRITRQATGDGVLVRRALNFQIDHVTRLDDLETLP